MQARAILSVESYAVLPADETNLPRSHSGAGLAMPRPYNPKSFWFWRFVRRVFPYSEQVSRLRIKLLPDARPELPPVDHTGDHRDDDFDVRDGWLIVVGHAVVRVQGFAGRRGFAHWREAPFERK